jgi:hypothetical protein
VFAGLGEVCGKLFCHLPILGLGFDLRRHEQFCLLQRWAI